ncbi:MAG TPA: CRTAC1 family protein [Thermoanaerobaculia bacterium]|nr:CRTAC1 family protein [Thermoanaerobaculia bacterium]
MRTLRITAIALAALTAGGAVAWRLVFGEERSRRSGVTGTLFRDVSAESAVRFQFRGDFFDAKLIPTMGGGVAAADYDGDGWIDLFFVTQIARSVHGVRRGPERLEGCAKLYRNRGDGTFEDATERSGIRACGWGISAMWVDLDSDGFPDLIVGNAGGNTVWRNLGDGTFRLVPHSGLESGKMTIGLAALDADGDGIPDIYEGNYLDTDPVREAKIGFEVKTPDEYPGQDNALYRGLGNFRFEDVTDASGTRDPGSKTIGAVALDYDGDGKTDLYVANDQWRNTLFHNEGGGRFRDVSEETGTGYPTEGMTAFGRRTRSGMGLVADDFDADGRPDLYVTNYAAEPNTLYRNVEGALFEEADRAAFGGDHDPTLPLSKWGAVAIDYDNDGRDDLAVSSGQILPRMWAVIGSWINPKGRNFAIGEKSYAQRQFLFHNVSSPGQPRFENVSAVSGDLGRLCFVGRGLAAADLDGDGRLDLAYNPIDVPAVILRNTAPAGKSIEILPQPGADRKTVLGAVVTVGGRVGQFFVQPSYASGSWLPLHFGIGNAVSARASVRWPDGAVQDLGDVAAGAWKIRKGESLEPLRKGNRRPD